MQLATQMEAADAARRLEAAAHVEQERQKTAQRETRRAAFQGRLQE